MNEEFDFGFSALDPEEAASVASAYSERGKLWTSKDVEELILDVIEEFKPLLTNLKKDPEKETIHWPDRKKRIEAFEDHLSKYIRARFDRVP
jgi:hypothetical protein